MYKLKIIALNLLLFSCSISIVYAETELDKFIKDKGLQTSPIASVTEKTIHLSGTPNNIIFGNEILEYYVSFDNKGNYIERYDFDLDGWLQSHEKYNEHGNIIESSSFQQGELNNKTIYTYNSQNLLVQVSSFRDPNFPIPNSYTIFRYDNQGNELERVRYGVANQIETTVTNKYDDQSNKLESVIYNSDNQILQTTKSKYDASGNLIESHNLRPDGTAGGISYFKYDNQNNLLERSYYLENWIENSEVNKYDSKGNLIESRKTGHEMFSGTIFKYKLDEQGKKTTETVFREDDQLAQLIKFDAEENIIEHSIYSHDNILVQKLACDYELDQFLNWTMQYCLDDSPFIPNRYVFRPLGSIGTVKIRIIEYHE